MASASLSRPCLRSVFALPPHLRTAAYTRSFSSTTPRQATLVELATSGPSLVLDSLHNFGLPWHSALPLTAVLIRSTLVYYISTLPSRRATQTNNALVPLVSAYSQLHQNSDKERAAKDRLISQGVTALKWNLRSWWVQIKYYNIGMWKYGKMLSGRGVWGRVGGGLLNFGVLIAFTEAIRVKCGSREGLLSAVLTPFQWVAGKMMPGYFGFRKDGSAVVSSVDPAEALAEKLEAAYAARQSKITTARGGELVDLSEAGGGDEVVDVRQLMQESEVPLPTVRGPDTSSSYFDPTLQSEGLLWCQDLTIPDPTSLLPMFLSLTMAATFILRPRVGQPALKTPPTTNPSESTASSSDKPDPIAALPPPAKVTPGFMKNLSLGQNVGIIVSMLFFYIATNMPAAILLYFMPSIVIGWAQNRYLDMYHPVRPPIRPCARPLRVKKLREW